MASGNQTASTAVIPNVTNTLTTDLELMRSVAATTDARNEEIRAMLQSFIGRMSSVPPSVWGGVAAARFKEVVDRWHAESMRLHRALHGIAETIRYNEATLRDAADNHAHRVAAAGGKL
ncbi:WXG100 family type VII secretion target [Mycobacterium shimoidei]|nr:WXG100 family type VII secretion target [Mycobacterium shimoidei]MCV7260541.1 WXG100 family type VII secretion target [Mycobacterium shimoidei]ODR13701.1 type VII secretion protein EsxU [Mycobacterium shimoidei]ORW76259.1 type VII secretion protein EsxU [Mycobacterium shimoidei]